MWFCIYTFYHCGTCRNGAAALFFVVFCVHDIFENDGTDSAGADSAGAFQSQSAGVSRERGSPSRGRA